MRPPTRSGLTISRGTCSIHQMDLHQDRMKLDTSGVVMNHGESDVRSVANVHMDDILRMAIERKASDIHITVGLPPMVRLDGEIVPLPSH